uniref:PSQ10.15c n=1 Tax=Nocardiopsis sp. 90127 TaxID=373213 RepID=Q27I73_9ACTN|nr:hypothetical protein [Nocardiopsis sp. 90127]ABD48738.1 pSQ10.15c [Nocardiopsis sp. 90127]
MSEPITPRAWSEVPDTALAASQDALTTALTTLTAQMYGAPDHTVGLEGRPAALRDYHLARIAAAVMLTEWLKGGILAEGHAAGRAGAPLTYTALGAAAGITKEGARSRWPGAVPDARPGRPRAHLAVRLTGGPAEWAGAELECDRAEVHDRALEDVGGHLITPSHQIPEGLPDDARAHYAPEAEDTRTVWVFQGWVPS